MILHPHRRIQRFEHSSLLPREAGRGNHIDRHVQIPLPPPVHAGHSRASQAEHRSILSSLGDSKPFLAPEGGDFDLRAKSRLRDGDGNGVIKVVALAVKIGMLTDSQNNIKIAVRAPPAAGFTFSAHTQPRPLFNACWDLEPQDFLLLNLSLAPAIRASLAHHLPHSLALWAGARNGEKALLMSNLASPTARLTGARFGAFLRPGAVAIATGFRTGNLYLCFQTSRRFFERNLQVVSQVGAAGGASALLGAPAKSAETEKVPKQIFEVRENCGGEVRAPPACGAHASVPELIVGGPLLRVSEHAVGFSDFLEFFLCFLFVVRIAVRMVLHGELTIGALDFLIGRLAVNTQYFVIVLLVIQRLSPLDIKNTARPRGQSVSAVSSAAWEPAALGLTATLTMAGRSRRCFSL